MKRIAHFLLLALCAVLLPGHEAFNCFSLIAGKQATDDGSVIIGHNEDDVGPNFVNVYKIAAEEHHKGETIPLKGGGFLPQAKNTLGFLWLEIPNQDFADSYFNDKGVTIASDACLSREDKPEMTSGGIGFMLRRIVAERARSAREGVRIAGELIDQFGYEASGRTYIIADASEGWFLHAVKGKHWIAQRVPDDHVAVIANSYTIGRIDLKDKNRFLGSPDIVEYAVKRGWYQPERDGEFDFARAYSDPDNYKSMGNILRQWRATGLLSGREFNIGERFPFSFEPRKKIRADDFFRVLRDHNEGTRYDLTNHYRNGSPHATRLSTICAESTQYSFVAQLRNGLPAEIANLAWIAFRRPDANAYTPWYFSISEPPGNYYRGNAENALRNHFAANAGQLGDNHDEAFWSYAKLSEVVDRLYRNRIDKVQKVWRNYENFAFKDLRNREKEFVYLLETNKTVAMKIITNYVHNLEYRKWFLTSELLNEFR